jgi:hypothetical protein
MLSHVEGTLYVSEVNHFSLRVMQLRIIFKGCITVLKLELSNARGVDPSYQPTHACIQHACVIPPPLPPERSHRHMWHPQQMNMHKVFTAHIVIAKLYIFGRKQAKGA